jgi:hypothetical protein
MKLIIETESEEEHLDALNGWKYRKALQELDNEFKWKIKSDIELTSQEWRDRLHNILNDNGLTLYE